MIVSVSYATPSVLESSRTRSLLALSADAARPVRLHARVARDVLSLRFSLQALGQLIWHSDEWFQDFFVLDPVITVHPDRLFFEAFSADQSCYGCVIVARELLEPEGEVACGTTNVDFTSWLWAALAEMKSSRETWLRIGPEGFEVATEGAGGRFEQKVEVPESWVRGFLQLQGAMALPGTRLSLRPVDLVAALRTLFQSKARVSPRALRYEMEPGLDAVMVLEPWEHRIELTGASHSYAERRVIRTWGRRRLKLLEPILPYATGVDVYLKGRAMPSFYAVKLPGVTFLLGLSGFGSSRFTDSGSFDLLVAPTRDRERIPEAAAWLRSRHVATTAEAAGALGIDAPRATKLLTALCAEGRVMLDVEARAWRWRELFAVPPDMAKLYPPDPRQEAADDYVARELVRVASSASRETTKVRRFKDPLSGAPIYREVVHRDWLVSGRVGEEPDVEITLDDEDRLIFGRCGCVHFRDHLLNAGPCSHMRALLMVARPERKEGASARIVPREAYEAGRSPEGRRDDAVDPAREGIDEDEE